MFSSRGFSVLKNKKEGIILSFLSVGIFFFLFHFTSQPKLTYDSESYLAASENATIYFTGHNAEHHSYLYRPPLLPLFLHFFKNKVAAAKGLNIFCFLTSLWLCYFLGRSQQWGWSSISYFIITVAFSYPWLQNHFFVWSEPLFSLFLILLIWQIHNKPSWVGSLLLCVVLFFIRKAGVFIAAGIFTTYFIKRDYKTSFYFGLSFLAIFASWEAITFAFASSSTTENIFKDLWSESRLHALDAFTAWFLPRNVNIWVRCLIIMSIGAFAVYRIRLLREFVNEGLKSTLIITCIYLLVFAILLGASEYGEADRYLSVILPLVMFELISFFRALYRNESAMMRQLYPIFFSTWLIYPIGRTIYHLLQ